MSWLVQPRLINGPFDDPGVYLDFRFGRRAILFDLGDLAPLSSRELMRVSHAFVSHTHMDHFAGFDRLFRVCLHRPEPLFLVGPPGFIGQVEHKIRAFTWNLVGEDSADFRLHVSEFDGAGITAVAEFRAREAFARRKGPVPELAEGVLLAEDAFRVDAAALDHGIMSLAFALRETLRVNVWRGALDALGFPVGPWLNEAKRAVRLGHGDETIVTLPGARVSLGLLRREVFRIGPGQAVAYVTDAADTADNRRKILNLARDADQLFIETVFLDEDRQLAEATRHLTARSAGLLARQAGAKHLVPFHYSARYVARPEALREEAAQAFYGGERRRGDAHASP